MMDCVILAGGRLSPNDLLYSYAQGKPKALIMLEGQTMLEWVVNALQASGEIADLCIVGIPALDGLTFQQPVYCLPDQGSAVQNAIAGLTYFRERGSEYVLISTADIPLISPSAIRQFVQQCHPLQCALYFSFHRRQEVEARFPHAKRTFFKLKGAEVTASNMGVVHTKLLETDWALWEAIAHARKHPWRVARVIGFATLLRFLCRQVSIEDVTRIATRVINMPAQFMLSRAVELSMDVDKPEQLKLVRAALRGMRASTDGESK